MKTKKRRAARRRPRRKILWGRVFIALAILIGIPAFALWPDSNAAIPEGNPADITAVKEVAHRMSVAADSLPHGSMEHIGAILDIRARETQIRQAGFSAAADSFAAEACRTLRLN